MTQAWILTEDHRNAFPLGKTKLIFWSMGKTAKKGLVGRQNKNYII